MKYIKYLAIPVILMTAAISCTTSIEDPPANDPDEKETYFQPGEYGGEQLAGTERLFSISPSPDGEKIALIRERTPRELDPLYQLWVMDRNGDNPKLITYNTRGVDWHPFENKISFTYNPHTTPYLYAFTLILDSFELKLLNSKESQYFNKYTSSARGWFADGKRLLFGVHGKAY